MIIFGYFKTIAETLIDALISSSLRIMLVSFYSNTSISTHLRLKFAFSHFSNKRKITNQTVTSTYTRNFRLNVKCCDLRLPNIWVNTPNTPTQAEVNNKTTLRSCLYEPGLARPSGYLGWYKPRKSFLGRKMKFQWTFAYKLFMQVLKSTVYLIKRVSMVTRANPAHVNSSSSMK